MTRKHYELIAEAFESVTSHYDARCVNNLMIEALEALCEALKEDNPLFNRTKFLTACGIEV